MTLLRFKDIQKMAKKEREEKLKELKFSLYKGNVTANRANSKTKEIKRAIARLLTFQNMENSKPKPKIINTADKKEVLKTRNKQ